MPQYKVYYFPLNGRAGAIRALLAHAEADWQNEVVEFNAWPALKPTMPNAHLPCLELEDGTKMGESIHILRYLGAKHGYYPDDPLQAQQADEIIETAQDVFGKVGPLYFGPPENREAGFKALFETHLPKFLDFIDKRCGNGAFLVGEKLSIADFYVAGTLYACTLNNDASFLPAEMRSAMLEKYPNFKAYGERYVAAN